MPANIIIPVASGKGGVGKSFLTANLAVVIAGHKHSTIAVDLDLGNSNLHSFFGLPNNYPGIGDFLRSQAESLKPLKVDTDTPYLSYIAGDGRMPLMGDITYYQKRKIIQEIKGLEADFILLDLGAGSHNDILDLFGIATRGIIVTTPEKPSVISMLEFLKNYLLRQMDHLVKKDLDVVPVIQEIYKQPTNGLPRTIQVYRDKIAEINPEIASEFDSICRMTRPRFIYNMGENLQDLEIMPKIDKTLKEVYSIEGDHFGFIFYDPEVKAAIREGTPLYKYCPEGYTLSSIKEIAVRIVKYWHREASESAKGLKNDTTKVYEKIVMEKKL